MSHETHRCDIGVGAFSQHQPKRNNSAGVAKYHGGVEKELKFTVYSIVQRRDTPLHCAASNGHSGTALVLVEAKADVNAVDQVCMYTYVYVRTSSYIHTFIHIYSYIRIHTHIYIHICLNKFTRIQI